MRTLPLVAGVAASYSERRLFSAAAVLLAGAVGALLLLTVIFFLAPKSQVKDPAAIEKLEQQMKKCC